MVTASRSMQRNDSSTVVVAVVAAVVAAAAMRTVCHASAVEAAEVMEQEQLVWWRW